MKSLNLQKSYQHRTYVRLALLLLLVLASVAVMRKGRILYGLVKNKLLYCVYKLNKTHKIIFLLKSQRRVYSY